MSASVANTLIAISLRGPRIGVPLIAIAVLSEIQASLLRYSLYIFRQSTLTLIAERIFFRNEL
jgi:hypothetical protein